MSEANSLRPIHRLQTGGPYSNALLATVQRGRSLSRALLLVVSETQ